MENEVEIHGVALSMTVAAPAFTEDLTITIYNISSEALAQFFTSPTEAEEWEEDVFGAGVPPGNTSDAPIADGREPCVDD